MSLLHALYDTVLFMELILFSIILKSLKPNVMCNFIEVKFICFVIMELLKVKLAALALAMRYWKFMLLLLS